MAAFYILAVDDREYKLKLTTASKIEAEKRLGFSLLEAPENITRAETFAVILWAALQKYHRTMTLPKVYDLIDEMEDNGCTISEKADLLLEVMKVSGFFRRRICKRWKEAGDGITYRTVTELIETLYPQALDAGLSPDDFGR